MPFFYINYFSSLFRIYSFLYVYIYTLGVTEDMATVRMLPSKTLQEWHYSFSTLASASSLYETALLQCAQPYWAIEDEASIANRILPCVGFSRLCMALINKLPTYVLFWHSYWCWKKRVPSVFFWFFFPLTGLHHSSMCFVWEGPLMFPHLFVWFV